jgi:hypothetical protein
MLIERRLRLLSPLLAAKRNDDKEDPRRVFVRMPTPPGEDPDRVYIATQLPRWQWAFLEARDALRLDDVAVSAIVPSRWLTAARTSTYNRKYRRGTTPMIDKFESLASGQVISMNFTLSKHVPPNTDGEGRFTRAPDEGEFDAMLSHIGEHLGMSEWGHAYLYGRFEIKKYNAADTADQTTENSE